MKKTVNPTVNALLEAYLKQENVKINYYPNIRSISDVDDIVGLFVITQNEQEVMKINVRDDDLKISATAMRSISYVTR